MSTITVTVTAYHPHGLAATGFAKRIENVDASYLTVETAETARELADRFDSPTLANFVVVVVVGENSHSVIIGRPTLNLEMTKFMDEVCEVNGIKPLF